MKKRVVPNAITIGRFTWDGSAVSGPAAYMQERGNDLIDELNRGETPRGLRVLMDAAPESNDPICIVLVWLQTDYGAWRGAKELARTMRRYEGDGR